jgi:hypothetical protein
MLPMRVGRRAKTRKASKGLPWSSTTAPLMVPARWRTKSAPLVPASALRSARPIPGALALSEYRPAVSPASTYDPSASVCALKLWSVSCDQV